MAEFPEIRAMAEAIAPKLELYAIRSIEVKNSELLYDGSANNFRLGILNKTIMSAYSYGKYFIIQLNDKTKIAMHFALKGELDISREKPRYADVIIGLCNGTYVSFVDMQHLSKIFIIPSEEVVEKAGLPRIAVRASRVLNTLGPEAISPEFNDEYLFKVASRSLTAIKTLLCNQSIVAGIGNTYADEILFAAGVLPNKRGTDLTKTECHYIIKATHIILDFLLAASRDAAKKDFRLSMIEKEAHKYTKIHCHGLCPVCKDKIKYMTIAGRGSYYCERCQGGCDEDS